MSTELKPDTAHAGPEEACVFPASFSQQRLWLVDQIARDKSAYNVSEAWHVQGPLVLQALEESLNEIIRRHDSLRTTFESDAGEPIQVVAPSLRIKLERVDLQHVAEARRLPEALRQAAERAHVPFDLACLPLIRAAAYQVGAQQWLFQITIHHIISDAWSMDILMTELRVFYNARVSGESANLPGLPIQYADYAGWQSQWLRGDVYERQLAYWKQHLAGPPAELGLATDRPHPAARSFRGASLHMDLGGDLARNIKALAQREGVTPFMIHMAAFNILLFRYTGQTDLWVGTPISNRSRVELEKLIGFFLNTLVIRTDLSGKPGFHEVLKRVRDTCLQSFSHQDLPFERLVEELRPERSFGQNPFFQVMFVFQNPPSVGSTFSGLELRPVALETRTSKFDLTLFMQETPDGLRATFEYDTDLFDPSTIERMAGHLKRLWEAIVANPELPVTRLALLTAVEREQILVEWNRTLAEFPRSVCVHRLVEEQAERTPDAIAVLAHGRTMTYRELNRRAQVLAGALRQRGIGPGLLVGVCAGRTLETLTGVLGILKAGGAYLPLDPAYPKERLAYMMEDSDIRVLLADAEAIARLPVHKAEVLRLDEFNFDLNPPSDSDPDANSQVRLEDAAYVIYTSGSTGKPKGVVMPHGPLCNLIEWQLRKPLEAARFRTAAFSPLSFDVSFQEMFSTWAGGGELVLISEELRKEPAALLQFLRENEIQRLFLPFIALQQLAEVAESVGLYPESIRQIITAGEPLQITPALLRWFKRLPACSLHNQYGPTETHVVTAHTLSGAPDSWPARPPIGRPIANARIYLLDPEGAPVPIGVPGELYIGGSVLARGYLNQPGLSAEKFVPDPFSGRGGARMYKSGDMASWRPDGEILFLGRTDHQVKVRGFRIELGEIESVLAQHPDVREAVAAVRGQQDKRLIGYIVARTSKPPRSDDLREFLRQRVPDYMIPSLFVTLDKLPLTPSGKVDRRTLPEPKLERDALKTPLVEPRNPIEERVAAIWRELLGIAKPGVHDNFFEVGGHSLMAVRLFAAIHKEFGRQLPISTLIQAPTIEKLSGLLGEPEIPRAATCLMVPIQPRGSRPAVFWIHTLGGGGGGGMFRYKKLAEMLDADQPSYGIQAPPEPHLVMETMAGHYVRAIRQLQPSGPYHLAGYCFGGNVAYEMARQLRDAGEEVGLLCLLDSSAISASFDPPQPWNREKLGTFLDNLGYWIGNAIRRSPSQHWIRLRMIALKIRRSLWKHLGGEAKIPVLDETIHVQSYPADYLRHAVAHWNAFLTYQPKPYDGPVVFFRAKHLGLLDFDPKCGWGHLVRGHLDVRITSASHETIFEEPHLAELAREIQKCLDSLQARRQAAR